MIHLAALLFAFAGFTAICVSMAKHQRELLGHALAPRDQTRIRLGGQTALVFAYAAAVIGSGWKFGTVEWVGLVCLGALLLTLLLPYRARMLPKAAAGAAFVGAMLVACVGLISIR